MHLEGYQFLKELGEGSFGLVYKCIDKNSQKPVAIKAVKNSLNFESTKIFKREIEILDQLCHPNIIKLIESKSVGYKFFLVFEFAEENILQELSRYKNGMDEIKVGEIGIQLLRAIEYIHDLGIMHRDIKPENILYHKKKVKLCDFGFARRLMEGIKYTEYVSTRWYRAPELLLRMPYDEKVDIFSFGCLLYEMRTGQALLTGDSDIDQLYLVIEKIGGLCKEQISWVKKCTIISIAESDQKRRERSDYSQNAKFSLMFKRVLKDCLNTNPKSRRSAKTIKHENFFKSFMNNADSDSKHTNKLTLNISPYLKTSRAIIN
eukprot:NODE_50_length_31184_cov_0.705099.p11 type:complete len:319 gc:universal NODE_50_length_31184_cov_0.705099:21710-22666(+)